MSALRLPVPESFAQRWGRRAVTVPLYLALAVLVIGGLPVLLPLALVVDLVRRSRWVAVRCVLFFALYLACEALGIVAALVLWRPARFWDERALDRHYALQQRWARTIFDGAAWIFGFDVKVEGAETVGRGPLVVLMRHASVADTPLPVVLLNVRHGLRMRYVLKRELLWDPCLDLVGQRIPNVFVRRGSDDGEREVALVARLAEGLGPRDGVLIYPEGTRFSPPKLARTLASIAERGDRTRVERVRSFRHVLPPRPGGAVALLAAAPTADVLIVAHTGFEGVGSFTELWNGGLVGARVRVQLRRVPRAEVPASAVAQAAWIDAQWAHLDAWLDERQRRSA